MSVDKKPGCLLLQSGYSITKIQENLAVEEIVVSKKSLCLLLKYRMTMSVADHRIVKPPRKLTDEHYRFIDDCMAKDDELTVANVYAKLKERYMYLLLNREHSKESAYGARMDD